MARSIRPIREYFTNPTKRDERLAELRAQGISAIPRFLGNARRSNQPQRTPATEGSFVVEYFPKTQEG